MVGRSDTEPVLTRSVEDHDLKARQPLQDDPLQLVPRLPLVNLGQDVVAFFDRPRDVDHALLGLEPRHRELGDRDPTLTLRLFGLVLLGLHVVDDEKLPQMTHLL